MSYRFCYGATGSGKSSYLQRMILEKRKHSGTTCISYRNSTRWKPRRTWCFEAEARTAF